MSVFTLFGGFVNYALRETISPFKKFLEKTITIYSYRDYESYRVYYTVPLKSGRYSDDSGNHQHFN